MCAQNGAKCTIVGYDGIKNVQKKADEYKNRYGVDIKKGFNSPSDWINEASLKNTSGDRRRMAYKLLEDYRNQMLGKIALEVPPWN